MGSTSPLFRSFNIIQHFTQYISGAFAGTRVSHSSPSDGRVMRMHYQWTLWLLLGGFACVYYNWFTRDIIVCVSHFNAEVQVRLDYLNICLTYPFTLFDGKKVTLLFYRYVHWVLLFLGGLYYLPRKLSKNNENMKLKRLFEQLNENGQHFDGSEKAVVHCAAKYMVVNMRTHEALFHKYIMWIVVSLVIDVFTFFFLDWLLLGRFAKLGIAAYPYHRDGRYFTDYISRTFPPFVKCVIGGPQQLTNKRVEQFGCHLTAMEIYEKLFFVLWFWLLALMFITAVYTIFLTLFFNRKGRDFLVKFSKPVFASQTAYQTIKNLSECCLPGDYFILYKMRQHFAHKDYCELLRQVGDAEFRRQVVTSLKEEHPLYKSIREEDQQEEKGQTKTEGWGGRNCSQQPGWNQKFFTD